MLAAEYRSVGTKKLNNIHFYNIIIEVVVVVGKLRSEFYCNEAIFNEQEASPWPLLFMSMFAHHCPFMLVTNTGNVLVNNYSSLLIYTGYPDNLYPDSIS